MIMNDPIIIPTSLGIIIMKKESPGKGSLVRIKGLEPPRRKASDPKSDVATNYTISALTVTKVDKKM